MTWVPDPKAMRRPHRSPVPSFWKIPVYSCLTAVVAVVAFFLGAQRAEGATVAPAPEQHASLVLPLAIAGVVLIALLIVLLRPMLDSLNATPRYKRKGGAS